MKHNETTSENQTEENQIRERVTRELREAKRDRRQNVLESSKAIAGLHEATQFVIFLEAIAHLKFVQDREAYRYLHKEYSRYISYTGGITAQAEDKFGWCPEVQAAAAAWSAYWQKKQGGQ